MNSIVVLKNYSFVVETQRDGLTLKLGTLFHQIKVISMKKKYNIINCNQNPSCPSSLFFRLFTRRYMAEIVLILRKTPFNQLINQSINIYLQWP